MSVDWSKEATSFGTFKNYTNDGRILKVFLHEQTKPIACTLGHNLDFKRAVSALKNFVDGDKIKYQSRGVNSYSPKEWFYQIEKAQDGETTSNSDELDLERAQKNNIPPFDESEKTSQKVYGPPGTGKTSKMMEIVLERLEEGVKPDEICFVSYTNVAANEAKDRIAKEAQEFGYDSKDFPFFKTVHALATSLGGLDGKTIMSYSDMEKFDNTILSKRVWTEKGKAESIKVRSEHPCLTLKSLATAKKTNYFEQVNYVGEEDISKSIKRSCQQNRWSCPPSLRNNLEEAILFWMRKYNRFKATNNYVDYDDVIKKVISEDFDTSSLRFKLLIIDEAQDCSDFMWDFLKLVIKESKEVYICGDDDQAIMDGFGANSQSFYELETTETDVPLTISYRLSKPIYDYLISENGALEQLKNFKAQRKVKEFTHNGSNKGTITSIYRDSKGNKTKYSLENLLRRVEQDAELEWLIIAPTKTTVTHVSDELFSRGISHYHSNRPRYASNNENVFDIRVQTIHTTKGAESENVAVVVISNSDHRMYYGPGEIYNPALRYVAESRAKGKLYLVSRS